MQHRRSRRLPDPCHRRLTRPNTAARPGAARGATGAQQALDLIGTIFIDAGDQIAVEAPAYVGVLTAFGVYEPDTCRSISTTDGMIVDQLEETLVRGHRPKLVFTWPELRKSAQCDGLIRSRTTSHGLCREAGIPIVDEPCGIATEERSAARAANPHPPPT